MRAAFRPEDQVCAVPTIMRHRQQLVEMAAQHVQHMHKALTQMNLQIHHVISDITGTTGLAIVDAIISGERNPAELAKLRDPRIKADSKTIEKSLLGNWREEHLFTLGHHWNSIGSACDRFAAGNAQFIDSGDIRTLRATFGQIVDTLQIRLAEAGAENSASLA